MYHGSIRYSVVEDHIDDSRQTLTSLGAIRYT